MYEWIWHRLPGGTRARTIQMVILGLAVAALLWFVIYPWASIYLPFDQSGLG
jgi:hypothetical protein